MKGAGSRKQMNDVNLASKELDTRMWSLYGSGPKRANQHNCALKATRGAPNDSADQEQAKRLMKQDEIQSK